MSHALTERPVVSRTLGLACLCAGAVVLWAVTGQWLRTPKRRRLSEEYADALPEPRFRLRLVRDDDDTELVHWRESA